MARGFAVLIGAAIVSVLTGANGWPGERSTLVNGAVLSGYRLVGTVQGSPEAAVAIFENPQTKQQKFYHVGDVVNGATIVEIQRQQVLLQQGTDRVTILLTGGSPVEPATGQAASGAAQPSSPKQALERYLSTQIPPYSPDAVKQPVPREVVSHFAAQLEQYHKEPARLVETPFGNGIPVTGFAGDVPGGLGLGLNEVIVAISGMGIDSPERLKLMSDILGHAKVFDLTLLQNGRLSSVAFQIENHP